MDIEKKLERFIADELLLGRPASVDVNQPLIGGKGILDSLTFLDLMLFVEKEFHIKLTDAEMSPENFETIAHIRQFIEGKYAR